MRQKRRAGWMASGWVGTVEQLRFGGTLRPMESARTNDSGIGGAISDRVVALKLASGGSLALPTGRLGSWCGGFVGRRGRIWGGRGGGRECGLSLVSGGRVGGRAHHHILVIAHCVGGV
jgi:hypothetical protein